MAKRDYLSVDWPRVTRAVYQIRQHYRYSYTGPVTDLKQRLLMIPPDSHGDQRLLGHRLDVRGADGEPTVTWDSDQFGNRICSVIVERVDHAVDFEATYQVERQLTEPGSSDGRAALDGHGLNDYLQLTALTAPDARVRGAVRELADGASSAQALAERAHDWAAGAIKYRLGVTGVQTPAAMALHLGEGVCQDYAHIMLSALRLLGVPARYVSGHLLGEGAPHAWVEALIEDPAAPGGVQVVPYDPTHHRRVGLDYITVALGHDYADISPTSGYFSGPAAGKLSSSKQAEILELEYDEMSRDGEDAA